MHFLVHRFSGPVRKRTWLCSNKITRLASLHSFRIKISKDDKNNILAVKSYSSRCISWIYLIKLNLYINISFTCLFAPPPKKKKIFNYIKKKKRRIIFFWICRKILYLRYYILNICVLGIIFCFPPPCRLPVCFSPCSFCYHRSLRSLEVEPAISLLGDHVTVHFRIKHLLNKS